MDMKERVQSAIEGHRPEESSGIVNLMHSLRMGLGAKGSSELALDGLSAEEIRGYRQVLLIVVDGLGSAQLSALSPEGVLARSQRATLSSVFPSTTATAVTSFLTGCFPIEHGLTGWHMYFRELGTVLAVLPGKPRYGGVPWDASGMDVGRLLGLTPFVNGISVASRLVSPRAIADSPFNRALRGRSKVEGFRGRQDFFSKIRQGISQSTQRCYHYAYWSDFDHIAHEKGAFGTEAQAELLAFEQGLEDFLETIRGSSTLVIVTADHGFIDHDPERVTDLNDYPEIRESLILPLSGESRAAYAYVRSGHESGFERRVETLIGDRVTLHRSADLVAEGWFGKGRPHPEFFNRIGDYVLIPKGLGLVRDRIFEEKKATMVGYHGGVHPAEMQVPLVVIPV